jgi:hypothetical protein
MKMIIDFVFGVSKRGEPVQIVNCVKVRETTFQEFEKWCTEFNVGCRTDRTKYSYITH